MSESPSRRRLRATVPVLVLLTGVPSARADIQQYEFRLVQALAKQGQETVLAVRLVDKKTGKVVPDAIIYAWRLDMAPSGMPTMTADPEPLPPKEPGIYQFKAILTMEGKWQLSLAAKIQGETGTLLNRLVLEAKD